MELKVKLLSAIAILILLPCCSDEIAYESEYTSSNQQVGYRVPFEDALKVAEDLFDVIDGATRSERPVTKIEVLCNGKTRSSEMTDTLLYLVNFGENQGFALLGADKRLSGIYAISDEGHMEFADTIGNPGLNFYMSLLKGQLDYVLQVSDTIPNFVVPDVDPYKEAEAYYTIIKPKLTKEILFLGQGNPFNKYCVNSNGIVCPTGCAPVAFLSFLSFYSRPTSYGGYTFPWEEMRENRKHDMNCRLLKLLGNKELLNVNYTPVGSGALPSTYVQTLEKLGLYVQDGLLPFDAEGVWNVLRKGLVPAGCPVLVRGREEISGEGHAWVIDGAMKQHGKGVGPVVNPTPHYVSWKPMYMFHCAWGWNGMNNGYFSFDNLSLGGSPDFYDPNKDVEIPNKNYNFTKNLEYIGYVRPL